MKAVPVSIGVVLAMVPTAFVLAVPAQADQRPRITAPVSHPATPLAGKTFEITFPVFDGATGARLTRVTATVFRPTISGKLVRPQVEHFEPRAGVAWMTMTIPAWAKGRLLKVQLTIKVGGLSATWIAPYRIG